MPDATTPLAPLVAQAQAAGAEGLFVLRGLAKVTMIYTFDDAPDTPLTLELVPPGVLLLAMLPDDGGQPGVEFH